MVKGAPLKPRTAALSPQLSAEDADGLEDVGGGLLRIDDADGVDVRLGADGGAR